MGNVKCRTLYLLSTFTKAKYECLHTAHTVTREVNVTAVRVGNSYLCCFDHMWW